MADHTREWDAELKRRGTAAVTAILSNDNAVGIGRGAEVRLSFQTCPILIGDTSRTG
jgi:hypothetical protein